MKIAVIGAGNVGSSLAFKILHDEAADVALVDINSDLAKGKALDLNDACGVFGLSKKATGSSCYDDVKGAEIVVVTAGLARRPGMSREDLLLKNAAIIKEVVNSIISVNKEAIIIMVTNPLDVTTYLAYRISGFDKSRVLGMAGVLDSARLSVILQEELGKNLKDIDSMILGTHGDSMVPLKSRITLAGKDIMELLDESQIDSLLDKAKGQGGRIVSHLKGGSAYYAPAMSVYKMIDSIINDKNTVMPASAYLEGEYGFNDVCLGVPVRLSRKGIEEIVELELTQKEKSKLAEANEIIKSGIKKVMNV
jgi:malate dehydrogenase